MFSPVTDISQRQDGNGLLDICLLCQFLPGLPMAILSLCWLSFPNYSMKGSNYSLCRCRQDSFSRSSGKQLFCWPTNVGPVILLSVMKKKSYLSLWAFKCGLDKILKSGSQSQLCIRITWGDILLLIKLFMEVFFKLSHTELAALRNSPLATLGSFLKPVFPAPRVAP